MSDDNKPEHSWPSSAEMPPLSREEAHVWRAGIDADDAQIAAMRRVLSAEERARADRFLVPEAGRRFTAGRALLRRLVARYIGGDPDAVRFTYGPHGKPSVEDNERGIEFNMSDSGGLALFAFTLGRRVGVDVERIRENISHDRIARRHFAPAEVAELEALPPEDRLKGFFNCWTRKEAYTKAIGEGLNFPLKDFSVSVAPCEPARLMAIRGRAEEAARWTLCALDPEPGYCAALAVEGSGLRIARLGWPMADP